MQPVGVFPYLLGFERFVFIAIVKSDCFFWNDHKESTYFVQLVDNNRFFQQCPDASSKILKILPREMS